jgi:hypothetical protein
MITYSELQQFICLSQSDKKLDASEDLEYSKLTELLRITILYVNERSAFNEFINQLHYSEGNFIKKLGDAWIAERDVALRTKNSFEDSLAPEDKLENIPLGEYLRAWGIYPGAMSPQCIQGNFGGISQDGAYFYLSSKPVDVSKTNSIQRGYNGPGALASATKPTLVRGGDRWYRSNAHPKLYLY